MALIAITQAAPAGASLPLTVAASGGGDTIKPENETIYFVFRNADASSKTVNIIRPGNDEYGVAIPDIATVVPAGATWIFGPLRPTMADPADNLIDITYSAVTTCFVAGFREA